MRPEVVHAYLAQHCFFLLLPQVPVGIQNAAAASKRTKTLACTREIQVHKLWTKVYSQKGLTAMQQSECTHTHTQVHTHTLFLSLTYTHTHLHNILEHRHTQRCDVELQAIHGIHHEVEAGVGTQVVHQCRPTGIHLIHAMQTCPKSNTTHWLHFYSHHDHQVLFYSLCCCLWHAAVKLWTDSINLTWGSSYNYCVFPVFDIAM